MPGNLITEQGTGEQNPLFQLAIDTMLTSATTSKQKKNRSVRHPQHTQTSFNSSKKTADSSNGYVYYSLFNRTYWIFRRNTLSTILI